MAYRGYQTRANSIWIIILTNATIFIVVFLIGIIAPQKANRFIELFGLTPVLFLRQPWTVLTSMFLHGGWWHIFANMFTLYFFGTNLSRLVGERKFLLVYFAGGLLGGIFYILLEQPFTPAVGASGAIFSIAGALTVMAPNVKVFIFPFPVPIPLWVAVIGGFLVLSFFPHVAWQAHLGGLIFGLIAGYSFRKKMRYYFIR